MVKPEKFGYLHLVYHFTVTFMYSKLANIQDVLVSLLLTFNTLNLSFISLMSLCRKNYNFWKVHKKTPVLESLFDKVARHQRVNLLKRTLKQRCFHVNFGKKSGWLLLNETIYLTYLMFLCLINSLITTNSINHNIATTYIAGWSEYKPILISCLIVCHFIIDMQVWKNCNTKLTTI